MHIIPDCYPSRVVPSGQFTVRAEAPHEAAELLPDFLGRGDLLGLGLSRPTVRRILAGERQVAREDLPDRLGLLEIHASGPDAGLRPRRGRSGRTSPWP